jgi:myo-inositol-1(or 4)-monophosphatase
MHPMLNTAVKAARKAGSIITRASADLDQLTVRRKRQNDFVSEVDHAAEEAIIRVLREAYPAHDILAEESGAQDTGAEYVWVIDPLDGTTNFLHGFPQYCVSIGLLHKGVPFQGVVFDPNRNELFTASKGVGAYMNDRRLRVSKTDRLENALMATGFPFREVGQLDEYLRMFKQPRSTSRGSPPEEWTDSGRWACRRGTWPRAPCWCARPAAWSAISTARIASSTTGMSWLRTGSSSARSCRC